jgi:hypothetical protein
MALWTPEYIDTALWLDAADSSTITENGGAVSKWADKSGNERDVTASGSGTPLLVESGVNSLDVLRFNGSSHRMTFSSAVIPTTHSLFVVFKPTIENVPGSLLGQWAPSQTGRFLLTTNQNDSGLAASGQLNPFNSTATNGAGSGGLASSFSITNQATLVSSICTTGPEAWKIYKNAAEQDSATITAVYQGINTNIGAEGRTGTNLGLYDGDICEVVILYQVANLANRQKIEGYLAHKWGLAASLPNDHPYKSAAPKDNFGTLRDRTRSKAAHQPQTNQLRVFGTSPAPLKGVLL